MYSEPNFICPRVNTRNDCSRTIVIDGNRGRSFYEGVGAGVSVNVGF